MRETNFTQNLYIWFCYIILHLPIIGRNLLSAVDILADMEVDMVADINVDIDSDININIKTQFGHAPI